MFRSLAVVVLLATAPWAPSTPHPDLVAAYPDPVLAEDVGEFVVVDVPPGSDPGAYVLRDGEQSVRLPASLPVGRVALAVNAAPARLAGYRVHRVEALPALANGGERLTLRRANRTVSTLSYGDGSDATVWTARGPRALGASRHAPVTVRDAGVTAFVLPDAPGPPLAAIRGADRRLLLAGYTLTSTRVADVLVATAARGVPVTVLLDQSPVGGTSARQAAVLDRLVAAGVEVRLVGGPRAAYAFHHAKYAVADDRAVVVTENWKPAGTGGHDSRGWGLVVRHQEFADSLAAVFRSDAAAVGSNPWQQVRADASRVASRPASARYPRRFAPRHAAVDRVTLAVTPDNAQAVVLGFVANATDTLAVQQVRLGEGRLRHALVDAAERGVRVRVLLGGAWYVRGENERLARCLNGYAARTGVPLSVAVAEPRSRYGKVHAKVAVADGERVLVGSLNWNEYALTRNREVVVVAEDAGLARYYGRVFRADWRGGAWRVAGTLVAAALLAVAACAVAVQKTVCFETDPPRVEP